MLQRFGLILLRQAGDCSSTSFGACHSGRWRMRKVCNSQSSLCPSGTQRDGSNNVSSLIWTFQGHSEHGCCLKHLAFLVPGSYTCSPGIFVQMPCQLWQDSRLRLMLRQVLGVFSQRSLTTRCVLLMHSQHLQRAQPPIAWTRMDVPEDLNRSVSSSTSFSDVLPERNPSQFGKSRAREALSAGTWQKGGRRRSQHCESSMMTFTDQDRTCWKSIAEAPCLFCQAT